MSQLLPLRPSIDHTPRPRSVVDLTDDNSGTVLNALRAETARAILAALDEAPAAVSDLASAIDSSLQNVQYHLGKLHDAGLVSEVGSWTSEKGRDMTVYALTSERVEFRLSGEPTGDPTPSVATISLPRDD